jgi:mannose-6-phosphate isomerase class I
MSELEIIESRIDLALRRIAKYETDAVNVEKTYDESHPLKELQELKNENENLTSLNQQISVKAKQLEADIIKITDQVRDQENQRDRLNEIIAELNRARTNDLTEIDEILSGLTPLIEEIN